MLALVIAGEAMGGAIVTEDWTPLWTTAHLSQARYNLAATSAGGKVFFGGGYTSSTTSNVVDIYDTTSGLWSTAVLSQGRNNPSAVAAGGKILFGGGYAGSASSNVVDIYDTASGVWSTASLSQARYGCATASSGDKVYFAGGCVTNGGAVSSAVVDIYNTTTGAWTTAALSQPRYEIAGTSVDGQVLFAGGGYQLNGTTYASDRVDIFDVANDTRSSASLTQQRSPAAASADGKALFGGGGGVNPRWSSVVDIYTAATNSWSAATLSQSRSSLVAASASGKVFFAAGISPNDSTGFSNVVDIFDTASGTWSSTTLSQKRYGLSATSSGNKVFFAGGHASAGATTNIVDIYTIQDYDAITSSRVFTLVDQTRVAGRMQLNAPGSLSLGSFSLTTGSMCGEAPINLGTRVLTVGADGTSTTYDGTIAGGGSLVKTGSGTLTLTAPNVYTGPTTISGGALAVDGSLVSPLTVNSGGTLGGTGTVGGVTVNSSGRLAPGNSMGTLTLTGNLSLLSGAKLDFELDTLGLSDKIAMPSSTLALSSQQSSDFNFMPQSNFGPGAYVLIDAGAITGSLGTNLSGNINGLPSTLSVDSVNRDLVLTVVPEPGTLALLAAAGVGVLACGGWRKRREQALFLLMASRDSRDTTR